MRGKTIEHSVSILSPVVLLFVWEATARLGLIDVRFFPAPSKILGALWELTVSGELLQHTGISLLRCLIGFVIGAVPGVVLGLTMGLFPLVRAAIWPLVGALNPVPKIAILPLVMLIFGIGESSKWVIIAVGVFFPVLINSMAGVVGIEKIYHDVGRNFGANNWNRYKTIALPGALPMVITGLRLAWGFALLLIVAAEFIAAKSGLGFLIWQSWQTFAIEEMYVGIIVISLLGVVSFLVLDFAARLLVPWRPEGIA